MASVSHNAPNRAAAPRSQPRPSQSVPLAGVLAGAQAALIGLLAVFSVMIAVWLIASHGDDSAVSVLRASGPVWLSTHLVPVVLGGAPVGLLPLLTTLVPVYLLRRGYRVAVEGAQPTQPYEYVLVAAFQAATYATLALVASTVMSTPDLRTSHVRALAHTLVLSFAATSTGVLRGVRAPQWVRDALRAGAGTAAFVVAAGAALVTASLALQVLQVGQVTAAMAPSGLDALFLTALGAAYLPNAAVWGAAYALGPGVSLGATFPVSMFDVGTGRVPAFPILAMVPTSAPSLARLLLLVPVAAGILLYAFSPRDYWQPGTTGTAVRSHEVVAGVLSVLTAAGCLGLAAAAAGGPLGAGQLAHVGPNPLHVSIAALQVIGGTYAAVMVVPRVLLMLVGRRRTSRSNPSRKLH